MEVRVVDHPVGRLNGQRLDAGELLFRSTAWKQKAATR
jgi:hypothetical protein